MKIKVIELFKLQPHCFIYVSSASCDEQRKDKYTDILLDSLYGQASSVRFPCIPWYRLIVLACLRIFCLITSTKGILRVRNTHRFHCQTCGTNVKSNFMSGVMRMIG